MRQMLLVLGSCCLLIAGCDGSDSWSMRPLEPEDRQGAFRSSSMDIEAGSTRVERESTSLELDPQQLQRFLRVFSGVVDAGIDHRVLGEVSDAVEELSVGESKSLKYPIALDGDKIDLEIQIFKDDDILDVYFFAAPTLISLLKDQAARFTKAMNTPGFNMDML